MHKAQIHGIPANCHWTSIDLAHGINNVSCRNNTGQLFWLGNNKATLLRRAKLRQMKRKPLEIHTGNLHLYRPWIDSEL